MLNKVTNNVAAPIQKQAVKNSTKSGSDFQFALNKQTATAQIPPKNVGSIELNKDGSFILLGDAIAHNPDLKPATVESLQADFGMTKAEAEEILRPKPVLSDAEQQKIMESSPAYIAAKKYSDSAQVEIVARDNNGQIVAVLWKDGSFMAENGSDVHGSTPAETRQNLLKMPNVHLDSYNANEKSPTRLDIEAEKVSFTKKHPELFQQIPDELLANQENQENQLHSFVISSVDAAATSKSSTGFKKIKPDFTSMTPNEFGELTKSGRFSELPPLVLPKGLDLTQNSKVQMDASLNTKVNYIELIQKQIEFNKSVGASTTYLDNFLNLMKNFVS